ncbi:MAG: hypothetical protein IKL05_03860, partial [Clostridia bacterium]|nr:hypothetical protein [Clostridia bacterium]
NIETDLENYVKIIIEKDGVEKEHLILLDEAELQSSYVPTELVPRDQFNFGEYALFVKIPTEVYSRHRTPIYSYAFITSNTSNSSEALNEYEGFNERYLIEEAIPNGNFSGVDINQPKWKAYYDFLSKSKVVYVSEEVDVIARRHLTDGGSWVNENYEKNNDLHGRTWNFAYEVLDVSGETIEIFEQKNVSDQNDLDIKFDSLVWLHGVRDFTTNRKLYFERFNMNLDLKTDYKFTVYTTKYGLPTEDVVMNVTIISDVFCFIDDYDGNNKLVLSVDESSVSNQFAYTLIFNFDTKETTLLEYNISDAKLSPDGTYVAYTPLLYWSEGSVYTEEQGFYIKEIETGKTVFYDFSKEISPLCNDYGILSWVKESKLQ